MRKNHAKFFIGLGITLLILVTSIVSGYFVIDRILVPKYFSVYGINNLSDLVDIVQTIYLVPDEKEFIINPHTAFDSVSATNKLITAGFPTLATGMIDYESIAKNDFTFKPDEDFEDNFIILTDKEVASIAQDILDSGVLVSNFPDLAYINTLNLELKQFIITPNANTNKPNPNRSDPTIDKNSAEKKILSTNENANIKLTIKLDTDSARQQISTNLNMPMFLVDWIIPDTIYVTSQMDTYVDEETGERLYKNASLSINSKTAKQSEVLLNLLISFIFPEDTYTIESLANELCTLALEGINVLGNMEFATILLSATQTQAGIKLYI